LQFTSESVSERSLNENRSTFGEVMDNIVVPCFLTHSVDNQVSYDVYERRVQRKLVTKLAKWQATDITSVISLLQRPEW